MDAVDGDDDPDGEFEEKEMGRSRRVRREGEMRLNQDT